MRAAVTQGTARALARRQGTAFLLVGSDAGPSILALEPGTATWQTTTSAADFPSGVSLLDMAASGTALVAVGHRRRRRYLGEVHREDGTTVAMTLDLIEPVVATSSGSGWTDVTVLVAYGSAAAVASDGDSAVLAAVQVHDEPGVMERSAVVLLRSDDGGTSWEKEELVHPVALSEGYVGGTAWHRGRFLVGGSTHRASYLLGESGPTWHALDQPPGEHGPLYGLASYDDQLVVAYADEHGTRLWSRTGMQWGRLATPKGFGQDGRAVRPVADEAGVVLVGASAGSPAVAIVEGA